VTIFILPAHAILHYISPEPYNEPCRFALLILIALLSGVASGPLLAHVADNNPRFGINSIYI